MLKTFTNQTFFDTKSRLNLLIYQNDDECKAKFTHFSFLIAVAAISMTKNGQNIKKIVKNSPRMSIIDLDSCVQSIARCQSPMRAKKFDFVCKLISNEANFLSFPPIFIFIFIFLFSPFQPLLIPLLHNTLTHSNISLMDT